LVDAEALISFGVITYRVKRLEEKYGRAVEVNVWEKNA